MAAVGWEIAINFNAGKFQSAELIGYMAGFLEREGWVELPIRLEHAVRAGLLPCIIAIRLTGFSWRRRRR